MEPVAAVPALAAPPAPAVELWRDFRRNRGAILGLAVVVGLIVIALLADVIAPYDPAEQYRDATLHAPACCWDSSPASSAAVSSSPSCG